MRAYDFSSALIKSSKAGENALPIRKKDPDKPLGYTIILSHSVDRLYKSDGINALDCVRFVKRIVRVNRSV